MPFFSIVTPVYNRPRLIRRAIESILRQELTDWEMIVVDDGSTDDTPAVVAEYADRNVRLIKAAVQGGPCRARNLGIEQATGEWVVTVDSDDELLPEALAVMREKIAEAGDGVDRLRFMTRLDTNRCTPDPPLVEEEWDYEGYLRFVDRTMRGSGETVSCFRRSTFAEVRYPDDRAVETEYHIEWAYRFRQRTYPIVLRLYHLDAENQSTYVPDPARWLASAQANSRSFDAIFARHAAVLRRVAPRAYVALLRSGAKFHFMAGRRLQAVRFLLHAWRVNPLSIPSWALFVVGMLGRRAIAWSDGARMQQHRRRVFSTR
jgi:glycosyltransferase involved in cell wall biosynthesis